MGWWLPTSMAVAPDERLSWPSWRMAFLPLMHRSWSPHLVAYAMPMPPGQARRAAQRGRLVRAAIQRHPRGTAAVSPRADVQMIRFVLVPAVRAHARK